MVGAWLLCCIRRGGGAENIILGQSRCGCVDCDVFIVVGEWFLCWIRLGDGAVQ